MAFLCFEDFKRWSFGGFGGLGAVHVGAIDRVRLDQISKGAIVALFAPL
jgi:hypothetical protein